MKIGFILAPRTSFSGRSNGYRNRCIQWAEALRASGTEVTLLSPNDGNRIDEFDVIHCFHKGLWFFDLINEASNQITTPIIISPIEDSDFPSLKVSALNFVMSRIKRLKYAKRRMLQISYDLSDGVVVRSNHEASYIKRIYNTDSAKIKNIPIGVDLSDKEFVDVKNKKKQVLHVSSIYQERKNVPRLIKACVEAGIHLVLAGSGGPNFEKSEVYHLINKYGDEHISYLGFVSKDQLFDLFRESSIFALPSIKEGVGNVALEAASFGCEVVLTKTGGPKEYFNGLAHLVDPLSVSSIKNGINSAVNNPKQPKLRSHIEQNHSLEVTAKLLNKYYNSLIDSRAYIPEVSNLDTKQQ